MFTTILFLLLTYPVDAYQVDLTIINQHPCPVVVELWGYDNVKWRSVKIPSGNRKRIIGSCDWSNLKIIVKGDCIDQRVHETKKNIIRGKIGYVSTRGKVTLKP